MVWQRGAVRRVTTTATHTGIVSRHQGFPEMVVCAKALMASKENVVSTVFGESDIVGPKGAVLSDRA